MIGGCQAVGAHSGVCGAGQEGAQMRMAGTGGRCGAEKAAGGRQKSIASGLKPEISKYG